MVDPIGPIRLSALSRGSLHYHSNMTVGTIGMWISLQKYDCGHYRTVDIIAGDLTLSQKYDCVHYRFVGAIAGDLTQSQEYDYDHYRNMASLIDCG